MDDTSSSEWDFLITSICYEMHGGISYETLENMPIPKLLSISHNLNKILKEKQRAIDNG